MSIYINLSAKNFSFIQGFSVIADISEISKYKKNVLFSESTEQVLPMYINKMDSGYGTVCLDIYIGDLDKNEIQQLLKGIKLKIEINGSLFGKKMENINIGDSKRNIKFEYYKNN